MFKLLIVFLSIVSVGFSEFLNEILPDPYPEVYDIEVLPVLNHGWYYNQESIENLVKKHNVRNIVEVGSWLGNSTMHFAKIIPVEGVVFAVDHWKGSEEHEKNPDWKVLLPTLFQQFLSNVIHENLEHKIIPVRMDSVTAASKLKNLDCTIDLVYLDGDHKTASIYADLVAWYPYIEGHGVICGDDWTWETIRAGVTKFAKERNLKIVAGKVFWYLENSK